MIKQSLEGFPASYQVVVGRIEFCQANRIESSRRIPQIAFRLSRIFYACAVYGVDGSKVCAAPGCDSIQPGTIQQEVPRNGTRSHLGTVVLDWGVQPSKG